VAAKLSADQIQQQLTRVPQWQHDGDSILRTYELPSFPAALAFASTVGHLAEAADHHPDILIQYKKVTLTLSTHSEGGLTEKDFALAEQVDALPMR
jgi:4a-hydroxytetrahydrobiopterin dehydratase